MPTGGGDFFGNWEAIRQLTPKGACTLALNDRRPADHSTSDAVGKRADAVGARRSGYEEWPVKGGSMRAGAEIEAAETRILLVEDDADLRFLMTHVLQSEGYIVDPAKTHAEATAQLDERRYALVIADWRLPDGEGTTIADGASKRGAKTILMTGYLFQMPASSAGTHETLMKPVRPTEIIEIVRRLIGQPGAR